MWQFPASPIKCHCCFVKMRKQNSLEYCVASSGFVTNSLIRNHCLVSLFNEAYRFLTRNYGVRSKTIVTIVAITGERYFSMPLFLRSSFFVCKNSERHLAIQIITWYCCVCGIRLLYHICMKLSMLFEILHLGGSCRVAVIPSQI